MISLGVVILAGVGYLAGYYGFSFWVLCYAIANGGLAAAWALMNPVGSRAGYF